MRKVQPAAGQLTVQASKQKFQHHADSLVCMGLAEPGSPNKWVHGAALTNLVAIPYKIWDVVNGNLGNPSIMQVLYVAIGVSMYVCLPVSVALCTRII